jgi:hypothetical protein
MSIVGIAFLPHKPQETYVRLFTELRAALIAEFDDIGFQKTVMMDFETAAHNALQQVFPEWTIKTCYFHFVKSVSTQVEKKVHEAVRSRVEFKNWLNQIFGMFCWTILLFVTYLGSVFLPIDDARRVFNHLLSNLPPGINDQSIRTVFALLLVAEAGQSNLLG